MLVKKLKEPAGSLTKVSEGQKLISIGNYVVSKLPLKNTVRLCECRCESDG